MSAAKHRYGDCCVVAQARFVGDQPVHVRGITAGASRSGSEHLAVTIGRVLIYLEDRAALDALITAVTRASGLADEVFGPAVDAFSEADRRERARIARTGQPPRA